MKIVLGLALTVLISNLIGSENSPITICPIIKKDDIRKYGSGNAGLTNVLRVYGKGPAAVTLLCDLAKGVIAVVLCRVLVTDVLHVTFFDNRLFIGYVAGLFVMLGHIFPVFYKFHGGKGVLIAATKYVSVGSICAAFSYPLFTIITQSLRDMTGVWQNAAMALVIAFLITYMHKPNIKRLKAGTENKFSFSSKK